MTDEERRLLQAIADDPVARWQAFIDDVTARTLEIHDGAWTAETVGRGRVGYAAEIPDPPAMALVPERIRAVAEHRIAFRWANGPASVDIILHPRDDSDHLVIAVGAAHPTMQLSWKCAGMLLDGVPFSRGWVCRYHVPLICQITWLEDPPTAPPRWPIWADVIPACGRSVGMLKCLRHRDHDGGCSSR